MPVFIDPKICDKEDICDIVEVCPSDAIIHNKKEGTIEIDQSKCTECLLCLKACPYLAVKLIKDLKEIRRIRNKSSHILKLYGTKPGRIGKPILKDSNFKKKVSAKAPTLVVFWGAHSGAMAPFIREIIRKHRKKLRLAYVKVADNPKLTKKYSIKTTPTLVLFKKGRAVSKLEGVRHRETIRVWVESNLT
ncbi:MAG: thioredoxin domain-containing protein [Candidatus Micrarchaeia archaeon]